MAHVECNVLRTRQKTASGELDYSCRVDIVEIMVANSEPSTRALYSTSKSELRAYDYAFGPSATPGCSLLARVESTVEHAC